MKNRHLLRDTQGATVVEMAFALPTFITLVYTMVQLGLVYRANSGIQHALGQGARYATLFPTPTDAEINERMAEAVYGIGPGEFTYAVTDPVDDPDTTDIDESKAGAKDLQVTYRQNTDLLFFRGPTINLVKSKRVWIASTGTPSGSGTGSGGGSGGGTPPTDPPPTDPPPTDPPPSDPPPTDPPPTDPPPSDPPPVTSEPPPSDPPPVDPPPSDPDPVHPGKGNTVCKKKNGKPC